MSLKCFTDGSCINNGKPNAKAAWACVWPHDEKYDNAAPLSSSEIHTNNRAEYTGCLRAFETADTIDPTRTEKLSIYTDSMLLLNSMTKWINAWKRNGWKTKTNDPVKNKDLLLSIDAAMQLRPHEFIYVAAHTGKQDWMSQYNDKADKMAKAAVAKSCKISIQSIATPATPSIQTQNIPTTHKQLKQTSITSFMSFLKK